ncbi:hypothetical protein HMPREF9120_01917 [Neisseria sp. oral taxon 020 str. F0370]|nr:hypothetical protein HMPREF9120_01917 [Neisseria sp. oral taxon 020 str. F0370]
MVCPFLRVSDGLLHFRTTLSGHRQNVVLQMPPTLFPQLGRRESLVRGGIGGFRRPENVGYGYLTYGMFPLRPSEACRQQNSLSRLLQHLKERISFWLLWV